jgi:hypothetical protein
MRASWPSLRAERVDPRTARWLGPLKPLLRTYEVQVMYRAPVIIELIDPLRQQPRVRVLSPMLKRRQYLSASVIHRPPDALAASEASLRL